MISEQKYIDSAHFLDVEIAAIKAVAEVESGGAGFLSTGEPVILFEPHIFWKQLIIHGIDPQNYIIAHPEDQDILYKKWGTHPYGKSSQQHARLNRATLINREAALESASWGKFQILGLHWKTLGYHALQDFINAAYKDEDSHLEMFTRFVKANSLANYLKVHDWASFALHYNGAGYKANHYDTKLAIAYQKYKNS